MSFIDTVKGAREEAGANIGPRKSKDSQKGDAQRSGGSASQQSFTRRSASRAKPSREAAAGVRMVTSTGKSKRKKDMTKEELKEERRHDREVSDLRYNVTQKMLDERVEYKDARKVWWRCLIVGVALMVLAIILYVTVTGMGPDAPEALGILGLLVMVAAYVVVVFGMIYDWRKIRPMRKEIDAQVQSMSEKRLMTAITKEKKTKGKGKGKRK